MCQFNLVFVKNSKNKKILKNNEYNYWGKDFQKFSPFVKGYCNCESFVSSMAEYTGNSYFEMIKVVNNSELKRLNKIKALMNKSDYKELKERYIAERDSLSNAFENFFEPLSNYEMEQIHLLEAKYKGKALKKQIDLLYKELDRKSEEIENSAEYKSAELKLNKFVEKNQLLEESTLYYLTKEEENNAKKEELLDEDLLEGSDDSVEYIDIHEESFVIDTVIQNLETKYQNDYNNFLEYKKLFENLLENEEYILFCCIWNEPEKLSIEKEVNINDIKIENLASLEYNQILKIYK